MEGRRGGPTVFQLYSQLGSTMFTYSAMMYWDTCPQISCMSFHDTSPCGEMANALVSGNQGHVLYISVYVIQIYAHWNYIYSPVGINLYIYIHTVHVCVRAYNYVY